MREVTKLVYYADDGTIFEDKAKCEKYEADIRERERHTTYWIVRHSPDTTEGRGYFGLDYIEAYIPNNYPAAQIWVEDWCIKTYGRKLDFVQGVAPTQAWILTSINRERFLKAESSSIGSTLVSPKKTYLVVGDRTSGLLIKEYDTKAS